MFGQAVTTNVAANHWELYNFKHSSTFQKKTEVLLQCVDTVSGFPQQKFELP